MWDFQKTTTQKSLKEYQCDASVWLLNNSDYQDGVFLDSEMALIDAAKKEGFRIKKGELYIKTKGIFMGNFSVFRARPEIDEICKKYDFYGE